MKANQSGMICLGRTDTQLLQFATEVLREKHWAIRGPIGQRKTLFLLSVLLQYVAMPDSPVIFLDLGGDQVAYWLLEQAARAAGKDFYFFPSTGSMTVAAGIQSEALPPMPAMSRLLPQA